MLKKAKASCCRSNRRKGNRAKRVSEQSSLWRYGAGSHGVRDCHQPVYYSCYWAVVGLGVGMVALCCAVLCGVCCCSCCVCSIVGVLHVEWRSMIFVEFLAVPI